MSCPVLGMFKRNILSVPVLLESNKYYGFIDIMDVVRYVVKNFSAKELAKVNTKEKLVHR